MRFYGQGMPVWKREACRAFLRARYARVEARGVSCPFSVSLINFQIFIYKMKKCEKEILAQVKKYLDRRLVDAFLYESNFYELMVFIDGTIADAYRRFGHEFVERHEKELYEYAYNAVK